MYQRNVVHCTELQCGRYHQSQPTAEKIYISLTFIQYGQINCTNVRDFIRIKISISDLAYCGKKILTNI